MPTRTDATTQNVREYLRICFHVTEQQINEALAKPENADTLSNGIGIRSFQDFVGDRIAEQEGWTFDEDAYLAAYEEEADDEDDLDL